MGNIFDSLNKQKLSYSAFIKKDFLIDENHFEEDFEDFLSLVIDSFAEVTKSEYDTFLAQSKTNIITNYKNTLVPLLQAKYYELNVFEYENFFGINITLCGNWYDIFLQNSDSDLISKEEAYNIIALYFNTTVMNFVSQFLYYYNIETIRECYYHYVKSAFISLQDYAKSKLRNSFTDDSVFLIADFVISM